MPQTTFQKEHRIIEHFQKKTMSANARTRCAILLVADPDGRREKSYGEVSIATGACKASVIRTLMKFLDVGFTKTITPARNPRSDTGRLKVISDIEAKIIAVACSLAFEERVRWTLTLLYNQMMVVLEDRVSIIRVTIWRTLLKNDLCLHLNEYWCKPPKENAEFVACMEYIIDVYQ